MGTGGDKARAAVELTGRSDKLGKREVRMSLVFLVSSFASLLVRSEEADDRPRADSGALLEEQGR